MCAQPTFFACDPAHGNRDCAAHPELACDPLVGLCVLAGANCTTAHACHAQGDFCSPVALRCVTPSAPGRMCTADADCAAPATCSPLTADVSVCGVVGPPCIAPLAAPTRKPKAAQTIATS